MPFSEALGSTFQLHESQQQLHPRFKKSLKLIWVHSSVKERGDLLSVSASMGKCTKSDSGGGHGEEAPEASKGVRKRGSKWVAEIRNRHLRGGRQPGRKWLGTFETAAEAREAYAAAVKKIKSHQLRSHRRVKSVAAIDSFETHTPGASTNTPPSLYSSLSSPSAGTGAKRDRESAADEERRSTETADDDDPKTSKSTRTSFCLDNRTGPGILMREKTSLRSPIPVQSVHHELEGMENATIMGCTSLGELEGGGEGTSSSGDDLRWGTWLGYQSGAKLQNVRSREFHVTMSISEEPKLGRCMTSFANSYTSGRYSAGRTSEDVSPGSSCATSRWSDGGSLSRSFDDSSPGGARGKEKAVIGVSHAEWPFDRAPALPQVLSEVGEVRRSHHAPGVRDPTIVSYSSCQLPADVLQSHDAPLAGARAPAIFSYSNTLVDEVFFTFCRDVLEERHSASKEAPPSTPMRMRLLLCSDNTKCSPPSSRFCNRGMHVQNNREENVERLHYFVRNGVANQLALQSSPQEREDLVQFRDNVVVKIKDLAPFKIRHILSELKEEFIVKPRGSEVPKTAQLSEFSHSVWRSMEGLQTGSPSAVCNELSLKSELADTLTLSGACLGSSKECGSSEFLPVDDLMEYF